jgi:ATP-dependent DNA helicase RecG
VNIDLPAVIARLRALGTDDSSVEAKRATGGLPESLASTICGFANRPGGGIVLLGIDENNGFRSVAIDAPTLSRQAADLSRQILDPPARLDIGIVSFESHDVVMIDVSETPAGAKPCRVHSGRHQGVWIRSFDGDYKASALEEQALYAGRVAPHHDQQPVDRSSTSDLDSKQVERYLQSRRLAAARRSRIKRMSDNELLHASGVLVDGVPSLAAFLVLGVFPQRLFPGIHVRAQHQSSDPSLRALDAPRIDGSIPEMIEATVDWVTSRSGTAIRGSRNGRVIDELEWPPEAVRELIGNALLHRDLSWSANEPVVVTLRSGRLIVRNPGGLYGITVSELGRRGITPAKNATLVSIATHVTLPGGERTVEQLATGIPTILSAFENRKYPKPLFVDDAVRFTVVCRSVPIVAPKSGGVAGSILSELGDETLNVDQLSSRLGRSAGVVRRSLRELADSGAVLVVGKEGKQKLYRRTAPRRT